MKYFIRFRTDDTVLLLSECGRVIGNFDCVETAEDAVRDRLASRGMESNRANVVSWNAARSTANP